MSRISAAAAVAALLTVAGTVATAAPAQAVHEGLASASHSAAHVGRHDAAGVTALSGTELPLTGFSAIVADPTHGHVFISGGEGVNGVLVTDLDGHVEQTLSNAPGASGMVLSPDASTLYVALADGDGIREIDTSDLTGATVSTGTSSCPRWVAFTAGSLWFAYGCTSGFSIGSLEPATSTVHTGVVTGLSDAPMLAASPGLSNALIAGDPGGSAVVRYDVVGGSTPSATSVASRTDAGENMRDLAVAPDGVDVVVASGFPYYQQVYKTSDLSADGTYDTSNYPNAVAFDAGGRIAAGIDGAYSADVWLFEPGGTSAFKVWDFGSGDYLQPRGLAFSGTNVYAVSGDVDAPLRLHVLSTLPYAPITVTASPKKASYGGDVKVTAHLTVSDPQKGVTIYATPVGHPRVKVKSGTLHGGTFSAHYAVTRRTTFTAVYEGGATYAHTGRSVAVNVHAKVTERLRGWYATRHGYALVHVGKDPKLAAKVWPNHAGNCVYFRGQYPKRGGGWKTFATTPCVALSSASEAVAVLTGTHVIGERARLRAEWRGDKVNLAQNGAWAYVRFTR